MWRQTQKVKIDPPPRRPFWTSCYFEKGFHLLSANKQLPVCLGWLRFRRAEVLNAWRRQASWSFLCRDFQLRSVTPSDLRPHNNVLQRSTALCNNFSTPSAVEINITYSFVLEVAVHSSLNLL